ncbi:MAG: universal stress protein [Flavobacterium sp.]|nr:universal stress protein [Flavobacterium sp.]
MIKILVPTDFSVTADNAFQFAVNLAKSENGEIILYHVFTSLENPFIDSEENRDEYNSRTRAELQVQLEKLKQKFSSDSSVKITTVLGSPPITASILDYASQNNCDIIIMGTQGASGLQRVLVGSEAGHIIDDTSMPVLLIPENFSGEMPQKIVFATTCNVEDKSALATAIKLTANFNTQMTIVHICDENNDEDHQGLQAYESVIETADKDVNIDFQHIATSYVTETMEKLDDLIPYDLVIMVKRRKSLFAKIFSESLSREMAYLIEHPLLIIPEK